ncbi:MAG: hypothetical protein ACRDTT_15710 [Pseudonocardiaceae bacterium]
MFSDRMWQQLVCFGPEGFPAYARLRFLPDPAYEGQSESDVGVDVDVDENAPTGTAQLRAALQTLTRHTRTPEDCYFCLWEGWGSDIQGGGGVFIADWQTGTVRPGPQVAPAFPPSVLHGPKVVVPHRAYYLFRGPVSDFGDWEAAQEWPGQPRLQMPDPAFIWPADHAWCVANDVDPHWAGIGADVSAIDRLLGDPRLDVVAADPRQDQPAYR